MTIGENDTEPRYVSTRTHAFDEDGRDLGYVFIEVGNDYRLREIPLEAMDEVDAVLARVRSERAAKRGGP